MTDTTMQNRTLTRYNAPGQSQLTYRAGTYATVLQRLIDYLTTHAPPDPAVPLLQLDVEPPENWGVGLLEAWSMVVDVLTFYQERIANEGYLGTTQEQYSLVEITRLTGYERRPGVSASVHLAFAVRSDRGGASLRSLIPTGTPVQSVPTSGQQVLTFPDMRTPPSPQQLPQVFETSQDFEARTDWNAITLADTQHPGGLTFWPGAKMLRLDGVKTKLRAGDTILLLGNDPSYTDQNRHWVLADLAVITPNPTGGYTEIAWEQETRSSQDSAPIKNAQVFLLRQQAKLYTYTRGGVYYSALDTGNVGTLDWTPSGIGLPNTSVNALICYDGTFFAATDNGVFRSSNSGASWASASAGLLNTKVQALAVGDDGKLFAGTSAGKLFISEDNGNNWRIVNSKPSGRVGLLALLPFGSPQSNALPRSVVRALTTCTDGSTHILLAASDGGLYRSTDDGLTWAEVPSDIFDVATDSRGGALVFATPTGGKPPLVGMNTGVYRTDVPAGHDTAVTLAIVFAVLGLLLSLLLSLPHLDLLLPQSVQVGFPAFLAPNSPLNTWLSADFTLPGHLLTTLFTTIALVALLLSVRWTVAVATRATAIAGILLALTLYGEAINYVLANNLNLVEGVASPLSYIVPILMIVLTTAAVVGVVLLVRLAHLAIPRPAVIIAVLVVAVASLLLQALFPIPTGEHTLAFPYLDLHFYTDPFIIAFFAAAVLLAGFLYAWYPIRPFSIKAALLSLVVVVILIVLGLLSRSVSPEISPQSPVCQVFNALGLLKGPCVQVSTTSGGVLAIFQLNLAPLIYYAAALYIAVFLVVRFLVKNALEVSLLPSIPVRALAYTHDGILLAGTERGIYRSADDGESWTLSGAIGDVHMLYASEQGALFIGLHDGEIYRSQDHGASWGANLAQHSRLSRVLAMGHVSGGYLLAGIPDSTDVEDRWSRFHLQQGQLDLDALYPNLAAGSWAVLRQAGMVLVRPVQSVARSVSLDYKKGRDFTTAWLDNGDQLATFTRDETTVIVQSDAFPSFDGEPVRGNTLVCNGYVPDLSAGQSMILSGKRIRLRVVGDVTATLQLTSDDGLRQAPFTKNDTLAVIAIKEITSNGLCTWELEDANGFQGTFQAPLQSISYELASDQDEMLGELVQVQNYQQNKQTTLMFDHDLVNLYDRTSVTICANIVPATQGQTVENEVLGSVDVQRDTRMFALKQKPLTYTSPIDAEQNKPDTLLVQVNEVPWQQVMTFQELNSASRAYLLRQDSQGNSTLTFGDGDQGAHLPSGREHVKATYRYGSGAVGNVPANSLTTILKRPPGIQKVTNPIAASGGLNPESKDDTRKNAPLHVQTTPRIVSLNDYFYFARAYAAKVEVKSLWNGRRHIVYVTVAGTADAPIEEGGEAYTRLYNDIATHVVAPAQPVQIGVYELRYFQLRAAVIIAAENMVRKDDILAAVRQRLVDAFSFEQRKLAQSVSAAEVIATMQGVAGVFAVRLDALYLMDETESLQSLLEAKPGRLEGPTLRPAQLLVINAVGQQGRGIDLQMEVSGA